MHAPEVDIKITDVTLTSTLQRFNKAAVSVLSTRICMDASLTIPKVIGFFLLICFMFSSVISWIMSVTLASEGLSD